MNRWFFNFKVVVLSNKDGFRFTAMADLGFDTYRRALICIRGTRQWHPRDTVNYDTEKAAASGACLTRLLPKQSKAVISTVKPTSTDVISVKADVAIPCRVKHHLCLEFEGNPSSRTPLIWLDVKSTMKHLEQANYDLDEADRILKHCQIIEEF